MARPGIKYYPGIPGKNIDFPFFIFHFSIFIQKRAGSNCSANVYERFKSFSARRLDPRAV